MKLRDISNGPEWIIWIVFIIFAIVTIVLLTGRGANFIAGYNTSSEEEKNKYDTKKLCRVVGLGMLVLTVFIFIMLIGQDILPAVTANIFAGVTALDCVIIMILSNTVCKK